MNIFFSSNKWIKYAILAISLFILYAHPVNSQAQSDVTATNDSLVTPENKPVEINNIFQEIERAKEDIKLTENKLKVKFKIYKIDSLFPQYSNFLDKESKLTDQFLVSNPNRFKIENSVKKWNGYKNYLDKWETEINQYTKRNLILIEGVETNKDKWQLTLENAITKNAPEQIIENVRSVLQSYDRLYTELQKENNYFLVLESRINSRKIATIEVVDKLLELKNSEIYQLLYLRHEPLWNTEFYGSNKNTDVIESESIISNLKGIRNYISSSEQYIYLFVLALLLLGIIIAALKKAFIKNKVDQHNKNFLFASNIFINKPSAAFIFTSILLTKLFFPDTPKLFGDILNLLSLFAAIPLLLPFINKHFKNIFYFVIIFYIADTAKTYIWFTSLNYRFYLLFEAALVIGALYYFTHPYLKILKLQLSMVGTVLVKLVPLFYLLSFVSIFSNLLGYTNLTDLSLNIVTRGINSIVVFTTIAMLASGFVTGYIHRHFYKNPQLSHLNKSIIQSKAIKFILLLCSIAWVWTFLYMTDLVDPLRMYFQDVLSEPYTIGSLTFTLGEISQFILILVISFSLTSFIAFVLDESSFGAFSFLKLPKGVPAAISLVIRYLIQGFAIILALSSLGIDLSKFNLMAGALGLGIGFGLQTVVSNFISGLILVFEKPILIGDSVEMNNLLGTVSRIGVRSSSITTFDGAEVVVPNNNLISNDLINWTRSNNIKRIEVLVGATYGADPNQVLEILQKAAASCPMVLKNPEPQALFNDFGDSSLNFRVLFWVYFQNGLQAKSQVSVAIYNHFKEAGIEIPFPQRDIHIKKSTEDTKSLPDTFENNSESNSDK